jgi:hypothetical protein
MLGGTHKACNMTLATIAVGLVSSAWAGDAAKITMLLEAEEYCINPHVKTEHVDGASAGTVIGQHLQ